MTDLQVETTSEGQTARAALTGELDLASVRAFEAELKKIEAEAPELLVIDLDGLEFMDSSGLRALVMADERARAAGRRLVIVPGPPAVKRVFEITQLDQRFDLVEDASGL